ncbi:MAG: dTMP kinase [Patescibacteria group bacterium]
MRNKFIVIEGIDGAGTTTQTTLLAQKIFENIKETQILLTREPTAGKYGKKIRQMLKEGKSPKLYGEKFLELFVRDRIEHLRFFENFNGIVISDRHKHSTYCYQQAQGVSLKKIHSLHKNFKAPDVTVLLDIPVKIALARMKYKKNKEMFDKHRQFLNQVRRNYLNLKNILDEPIIVINGIGTKMQVLNRIWQKLKIML